MHLALTRQPNGEPWHVRLVDLPSRVSTAPQALQVTVTVSLMRFFFALSSAPRSGASLRARSSRDGTCWHTGTKVPVPIGPLLDSVETPAIGKPPAGRLLLEVACQAGLTLAA